MCNYKKLSIIQTVTICVNCHPGYSIQSSKSHTIYGKQVAKKLTAYDKQSDTIDNSIVYGRQFAKSHAIHVNSRTVYGRKFAENHTTYARQLNCVQFVKGMFVVQILFTPT